ncbi:MAG: hypothetical protein B7Y15_14780 [Bacteroidetes bacterium 24-39-8]|nr:MAG: hypothetical protein B7Y15_14780 [Bacteroidetes bacterium 24-39-8]OZA62462.1 MAG: hypothetical protein B7X72_11950 [Sphingobacteriia bacterium 39-39-8]HQR93962.1 WG repeat-containing protein [Sediminibacterium sp.]HQS56349.1 WG repeat-containing protein [Sediminibacterium sp.]
MKQGFSLKILLIGAFMSMAAFLMAQDLTKDYWYPVIVKGKMGYIDKTGKLKINAAIERPSSYSMENVHTNFIVVGNTKKVLYNRQAKIVIDKYFSDIMIDETSKLIKVSALSDNSFSMLSSKKGWYDYSGKEVIPVAFDTQILFGGYMFYEGLWCFEKDGKQGFMDTKGNIVIQPQFEYAQDFTNGLAAARKTSSELSGYINYKGDFAIKPQFSSTGDFDEAGYALVRINKTDKTQSIINKKGKVLVKNIPYQPKSDGLESPRFKNGLVPIYDTVQKKYGYMDYTGKTVIPIQFVTAKEFDKSGTTWVNIGGQIEGKGLFEKTLGGKWALIDTKGNLVIPYFRAEQVSQFVEDLAAVKMNGLWGFMNLKGEIVIEPQWKERPGNFDGGLARINEKSATAKEGTFSQYMAVGYINKAGQFIWPIQE